MRGTQEIWLIIAGMGATTAALRLSMLFLLGRVRISPLVTRALRFVPPAVFSALVLPTLLRPAGPLDLSPGNPYLIAGTAAAAVAWRSRSMMLTIAAGMIVLWIVR